MSTTFALILLRSPASAKSSIVYSFALNRSDTLMVPIFFWAPGEIDDYASHSRSITPRQ
jgi:hypothetical protein